MEYYFRKKDDLPSIPELPDPFEKPDGSRVMAVSYTHLTLPTT